ncbi:Ig-like domain-containing protein [Clostridium sp. D46t1_190503_E9]|uniref:Ig-like domain-containing protein n=1 Tax=Clostridium sp. D46t1_190503_E9 TaxID=2787137 RepID=UPI0018993731|nr:Ig-like domain-containing protein [Clostridium sp. D46t1_190503_E9]
MNKKLFSKIMIISVITISSVLVSCQNTSKKITISEDTKNEISSEENEINEAIKIGEEYLAQNKFNEAKESFNKAISLDKNNKDVYLKIKDIYMSFNRFDDAYFIIKTALTNTIDIENMKLILKDISSKFESINMNLSIYQDTSYTLPNEVKAVISGESISIPVTWDNQVVDSSTAGTFVYEGFNEDYGRKVNMEITVMENVYDKQIGWVKNFYMDNGKLYINLDLIEFYLGREEALREAIKDGKAGIDENGEYFLPAPVWIRNNSEDITTYQINDDCLYSLCAATLNLENYESSGTLVNSSYDNFSKTFNDTKNNNARILLVWVDIKNGSVYKISEQYLP